MQLSSIFLQAAASPQGGSTMLLFMIPMILIFYFFMIRPQAKKAKQQKQYINDMKKGDKIVTIAGIHGTINKVNDDNTMMLEVSPGSYIKIEKSSISMDWTVAANKPAATADAK